MGGEMGDGGWEVERAREEIWRGGVGRMWGK